MYFFIMFFIETQIRNGWNLIRKLFDIHFCMQQHDWELNIERYYSTGWNLQIDTLRKGQLIKLLDAPNGLYRPRQDSMDLLIALILLSEGLVALCPNSQSVRGRTVED